MTRAAGVGACARLALVLAVLLVTPGLSAGPLSAQSGSPDAAAAACVTAGGQPAACGLAAVVGLSSQAHLALLGGLGSEVSGTATTLGTRVQGGPRLTFAVRLGLADAALPDPGDPSRTARGPASALHADVALGLFEGLRLMPTVGGFLSLDAFGRAAFVRGGGAAGFGSGSSVYTAGVRVGIFREGFTIPGVSASISRRFVGAVDVGNAGDLVQLRVDPGVTSIRATAGKDLFAVEWLVGFGWDDFGGDLVLRADDGASGVVTLTTPVDGSRRLWFASASRTFSIVLNLSIEAGWAEGFDPVASYSGAYDPTASVLFGGLSARLIL